MASRGDWEWWLELARRGHAERNYLLVGQIDCFIAQVKAMGFVAGSGFGPLPPDTHRTFDEITAECLAGAPGDLVIQDGSAGLIDAETARNWAAARIQKNMH